MARPLRIDLAGGLYHVTSRGDRREAIYRDAIDRAHWLTLLTVVETPDAKLSHGMRQLNGVHTQATNRRHRLVSHLFPGRFQAILVERDTDLLELARYVVLNPVRAGLVANASDWPWNSYRAMIGQVPAPPWLETDWIRGQFGAERSRARARVGYAAFVRAGARRAKNSGGHAMPNSPMAKSCTEALLY